MGKSLFALGHFLVLRVGLYIPARGREMLFIYRGFFSEGPSAGRHEVRSKKNEVNKKHLPGPRVGRYLPTWRAGTAWFH